jgi:hypothetical protein
MFSALRRLIAFTVALQLVGLSGAGADPERPGARPLFFQVPGGAVPGAVDCTGAMFLAEPPGWSVGDAAAVVVADHGRPDPLRDRVITALLADGALVLELQAGPLCGGDVEPVATLYAALRAVRSDAGAGLVIALGRGIGAEAVLLAMPEAVALAHLGPSVEGRFAAAVGFGHGAVVFVPGPAPAAEQAWPRRAAPLCEALARAAAPAGLGQAEERIATARGCLAALVPAGVDRRGQAVAAAEP